jgi:hypothetical protein
MSATSYADTNRLIYVPPSLLKYESDPVDPRLALLHSRKVVVHTKKLVKLGQEWGLEIRLHLLLAGRSPNR